MQSITNQFPCLTNIFSKLEQRKTMSFLRYSEGGYYDSPWEILLSELWDDCHDILDSSLPNDISLWERYMIHDTLDFLLYQEELLWDVEMEGRFMFDMYNYPPEEDVKLYNRLEECSLMRLIITPGLISAKDLGI